MDEILEARRVGQLHEMFATGTGAGVAAIGELGWRGERIVAGDGGEGPLARRLGPGCARSRPAPGPMTMAG